jgi:hypothetical protein
MYEGVWGQGLKRNLGNSPSPQILIRYKPASQLQPVWRKGRKPRVVSVNVTTILSRATTRPAFRGTVPKTYVKSHVPHFAWNVSQISVFVIYSTILNFRIWLLFRFYVNSVTEYFVPMVLFTKYNIHNSSSRTWNVKKSYMNCISLCLFMAIKFVWLV